ncbi:GGDEF domain-containing protein [Kiloniella majae]|uniref:GGDEF domain-containing protein n=1 Tax=Kiloniella majae TaxID=1938558 RepID=UPI000A2770E7|nr:GGDEF domain-containing protein [Kiloniella majae]
MLVADSFTNAQAYAEQAITIMGQRGIPSTPPNYTIWYDYVSGKNTDLKIAIDKIIQDDKPFTLETCNELYKQFYLTDATHGDHLQEAGARIQETLQQVIQQISEAGSDNANYGEKITSIADDMAGEDNSSSLQHFVQEIVRETAAITEKNKVLQSKLQKSSSEIDTLQENLEKVRTESLTDALTQIGNRKLFDTNLIKEAEKSEEEKTDLCLLLMDIDHFKKFNDTYGHRVGDEVLRVVAGQLKRAVKGQDTPARYGGEEFTCILPNTSLHDATSLANQIREKIAKQVLRNKKTGQEFGRITLSIGVSKYVKGESLEGFIQRADEALYRAKDQGRNRVIQEIS